MEDSTPWWFGLTEEELAAERAEEARQDRLADEAYRELPDDHVGYTDEF